MKQTIEQLVQQALREIIPQEQLHSLQFSLERPRDSSHGDWSTNVAMVMAKALRMPPRVLAEKIVALIPSHIDVADVHIAGPGFINFVLSTESLTQQCESMYTSTMCGVVLEENVQTVVVDYSSPNLAKEMHVGHLRSTIIGDAIARMLEWKGYHVIRQNHVGDWGTQFGMLLAHMDDKERAQPHSVDLRDLESFYKEAKQRFDTEEIFADRARQWVVKLQSGDAHSLSYWKHFIALSLAHCQAVYDRLGVTLHEKDVRAESAYNDALPDIVLRLREQGLLVEHEGAQCVFLDIFKGKDDTPLPIIVQKRDGGFLYASTDLAAIRYRQTTLKAQRVLYVVDARQSLHFQQMFALARKAGFVFPDTELEHISFGMVLDKTGKPYKSRDGGVTKLADLLEEATRRAAALLLDRKTDYSAEVIAHMAEVLGIAAVKYADLSKNRTSDYIFDWDTMLSFEGNTAPYLLYAYTRIQSLFHKANMTPDALEGHFLVVEPAELALMKHIIQFPSLIDTVIEKATPHLLCTYLYELAGSFSSFYEACPILNQASISLRISRLRLAALTARILKQGLNLLGIEVLNRM